MLLMLFLARGRGVAVLAAGDTILLRTNLRSETRTWKAVPSEGTPLGGGGIGTRGKCGGIAKHSTEGTKSHKCLSNVVRSSNEALIEQSKHAGSDNIHGSFSPLLPNVRAIDFW